MKEMMALELNPLDDRSKQGHQREDRLFVVILILPLSGSDTENKNYFYVKALSQQFIPLLSTGGARINTKKVLLAALTMKITIIL